MRTLCLAFLFGVFAGGCSVAGTFTRGCCVAQETIKFQKDQTFLYSFWSDDGTRCEVRGSFIREGRLVKTTTEEEVSRGVGDCKGVLPSGEAWERRKLGLYNARRGSFRRVSTWWH